MVKLFLLQVIVLFLVFIILDWVRVAINKFYKKGFKLRLIDSMPILSLYFVHYLTISSEGFSWDASLIFIWMVMGIVILIHKVFVKKRLTHKNYYLTLWRVGDLYLLVAWLIAGAVSIF